MVSTSSPRPQPQQTRSTGWVWPRLVDVQVQKDKAVRAKREQAASAQISAAPSADNLRESHDVSILREEQSAPTSPTRDQGSPEEGKMSGHRAEASENVNAVDVQPRHINTAPQLVLLPEEPDHEPEIRPIEHGEQTLDNIVTEHIKNAELLDESPPKTSPIALAADSPQERLFPGLKQAGLLPEPEITKRDCSSDNRFPGFAQASLAPAEMEPLEPNKPLPPPKITIQRPSNSDISESNDDEIPAALLPTPEPRAISMIQRPSSSESSKCIDVEFSTAPLSAPDPRAIDSVLSENRPGTKRFSLKERLEEKRRRTTSELTQQDRERIIQNIAGGIAAVPPDPIETEDSSRLIDVKVKRRMKVRSVFVRGPVLKLLLGRQLAGPTKEALKMYAHGKAVPVGDLPLIPEVAAGV